jgi:hypothetical protein
MQTSAWTRVESAAGASLGADCFTEKIRETVTGGNPRSEKLSLTYSMDPEFSEANVFRYIMKDPERVERLRQVCVDVSKSDILKLLKMSERQFNRFALRKGVDPSKTKLQAVDLNPEEFQYILSNYLLFNKSKWSNLFYATRAEFVSKLRERGFPVKESGHSMEIAHESFETDLSLFKDLMNRLHKEVREPRSHFHIGLPSATVTRSQALSISRALETKVVLRLALEEPESQDNLAREHKGTPLAKNFDRGIVYLKYDEFKSPVLSHDLELREWMDLDHGLEMVDFASKLASDRERLVQSDEDFGRRQQEPSIALVDPRLGNLKGALEYTGMLLKKRDVPSQTLIGEQLEKLASEITEEDTPVNLRKTIRSYLMKNHVLEMLDESVFLTE